MAQSVIAIVADCDDTLAPDTTGQLLARFGIDPKEFYAGPVGKLVEQGFDPPVAYMHEMLRLARDGGPLAGLTKAVMEEIGQKIERYPGVPEIFLDLEAEIKEHYAEYGIRLEEYVISGGIADLIAASPIGKVVDGLWGCNFAYDDAGRISAIKNVLSFTEKTRFVFAIEKGVVGPEYRNKPYAVNEPMDGGERRVPLKNMVYLGDGPSDIPCMSVIQKASEPGYVIGILSKEKPYKTWALGYGRRANVTVPPDFTNGDHAYMQLRETVIQYAERIKRDLKPKGKHSPGF